MTQANNAEIVRVYTRELGGTIEDLSPTVSAGSHQFEVIVEAEAGSVRANNDSSYTITLTAFDITAGQSAAASISATMNPATLNQRFRNTSANLPSAGDPTVSGANNITAWPAYEQRFVITLTAAQAANAAGHVCQYTAKLQTPLGSSDPIVSITQSKLFTFV
jgi:hypothetical protein